MSAPHEGVAAPESNGAGALGPSWLVENRQFREVKLAYPIRDGGKNIGFLRIRQPVVMDLEHIRAEAFQTPVQLLLKLLSSCAGVSDTAIRLLTISDMAACTRALGEMGFTAADAYSLLAEQPPSSP